MTLLTRIKKKKAQVVIELAIGLTALLILLVGISKGWLWVSKCLVERQENYESTRLNYFNGGTYQTYYTPPTLDILN